MKQIVRKVKRAVDQDKAPGTYRLWKLNLDLATFLREWHRTVTAENGLVLAEVRFSDGTTEVTYLNRTELVMLSHSPEVKMLLSLTKPPHRPF